MSPFPGNTRVYLATGATDMRKAIDGLSILVAERLALDPFSGYLSFRRRRGVVDADSAHVDPGYALRVRERQNENISDAGARHAENANPTTPLSRFASVRSRVRIMALGMASRPGIAGSGCTPANPVPAYG